jgi:hypothetical protein
MTSPRTVEKRRVVKGMAGEQRFQVGRARGVEIHPRPVDHEADRRLPGAAGMERPEKGVLHPDIAAPVLLAAASPRGA